MTSITETVRSAAQGMAKTESADKKATETADAVSQERVESPKTTETNPSEVQLSDEPLLDHMATELEQNDFHIHTAIRLVVLSPQFRNVRGRKQETNGRD